MKRLLPLLLLLAAAPTVVAQAPNDQWIDWSEERRLTWSDYRGLPHGEDDIAASTHTQIVLDYSVNDGRFSFDIASRFSPTRSWGRHRSDYILRHEQGHFDIAEIFARRLNKALLEYAFDRRNYRQDISAIYESVMEESEAMQRAYDRETRHSIDREKQEAWEKRIAALLKGSEAYAAY